MDNTSDDSGVRRISDPKSFILAETRIKSVPHAEEIRLHLADEAMDLWQKTEDDLGQLGLPPPFWAFAWAGGQALARHILDNPNMVRGKTILDFASGSGLVAIAAMKSGATSCRAVDIDPFALEAGRLNAALNGVSITFEQADITTGPIPEANVVFCGDVFYDKQMADRVLAFIDRILDNGTPVFVGDPGRSYLPRQRLNHIATYTVPVVGALEDSEVKKSSVYSLIGPC